MFTFSLAKLALSAPAPMATDNVGKILINSQYYDLIRTFYIIK